MPENLFGYRLSLSPINIIKYLKKNVSKSNLTFMVKTDLKNLFPSLKKNISYMKNRN